MSWIRDFLAKLFPVFENENLNAQLQERARENSEAVGELRQAYAERSIANRLVKREITSARIRADIVAFERGVKQNKGPEGNA